MATRLNKDMIEQIVAAVIKDTTIPNEITMFKAELYNEATRRARELVPPALMELTKKYPREWFHWDCCIYIAGNDVVSNPMHYIDDGSWRAANLEIEPTPSTCESGSVRIDDMSWLAPFEARARELGERRSKIKDELRAYLKSRSTVESAVRDMPELEPFVTVKVAKNALVAPSNVLASLTASGFSVSARQQKA